MSESDPVRLFIAALSVPGAELRTYQHAAGSVWDETTWDDDSKAAILNALTATRTQAKCVTVDNISNTVRWDGGEARVRPQGATIMQAMLERAGGVRAETLIDVFYGCRADGGPDDPRRVITQAVWQLRQDLRRGEFPGTIRSLSRGGWGGWKLELQKQSV